MFKEAIEKEYSRLTSEAETAWSEAQTVGGFVGLPSGYSKLGIAIGSLCEPNNSLARFLDHLARLALGDRSLVLVPRDCSHFTFLSVAGHHWNNVAELPAETATLKPIISGHMKGLNWELNDLRLVPGNNFLLLAGVPDERSYAVRRKLAEDLKTSSWKNHIHDRYESKGYPFPPIIWHTTLCRYQHEFLPQNVRELFRKFQNERFDNVQLGQPELRAINYDWTVSSVIG